MKTTATARHDVLRSSVLRYLTAELTLSLTIAVTFCIDFRSLRLDFPGLLV